MTKTANQIQRIVQRWPVDAKWVGLLGAWLLLLPVLVACSDGRRSQTVGTDEPVGFARANLLVEPEFGVDDPVDSPPEAPGIVLENTGTEFLAAWANNEELGGPSHLQIRRLSTDGHPIGRSTLDIVEGTPLGLARLGERVLFAYWQMGGFVRWMFLDLQGNPVTTPVTLPGIHGPSYRLACNGSEFLLAWLDTGHIYAHRIDAAGAWVGDTITVAANGARLFALASSGDKWAVAWTDANFNDGWLREIGPSGAPGEPIRVNGPGDVIASYRFAFAASPAAYLFSWESTTSPVQIVGRRFRSSDLSRVDVDAALVLGTGYGPSIAFDGSAFIVGWDNVVRRVSVEGPIVDSARTNGAAYSVANSIVAASPPNALLAWEDPTYYSMFGQSVTGGAFTGTPSVLLPAASEQRDPRLAFDGQNYLVVWADRRNLGASGWDIYGSRVTTSGKVLDRVAIPIGTEASSAEQVRVVWAGEAFVVAWVSSDRISPTQRRVLAARVTRQGVVLDSPPLVVGLQAPPDLERAPFGIATDGSRVFVVSGATVLSGRFIEAATGAVSAPIEIADCGEPYCRGNCAYARECTAAAVAYQSGKFMVLWAAGNDAPAALGGYVNSRVVFANGELGPIRGGLAQGSFSGYLPMDVTAGSTGFLGVFQGSGGLRAQLLDTESSVLLAAGTTGTGKGVVHASAAFDGCRYVASWQTFGASQDIAGAWIDPAVSTVSQTATFSGASVKEQTPALWSGGNLHVVLAYSTYVATPDVQNRRVKLRFITSDRPDGCVAGVGGGGSGGGGAAGTAGSSVGGTGQGGTAGGAGQGGTTLGGAGQGGTTPGGAGQGGTTPGGAGQGGVSHGGSDSGGTAGTTSGGTTLGGATDGGAGNGGTDADHTGGSAGSGERGGAGGEIQPGSGGAGAPDGGGAMAGGGQGGEPPGDNGCSCSVPGSPDRSPAIGALAGVWAAILSLARRRRGRSAGRSSRGVSRAARRSPPRSAFDY